MKILITGDSHTGALQRGLMKLSEDGRRRHITIAPISAGASLASQFYEDRGDHLAITVKDRITAVDRFPVAAGRFDWYGLSSPYHVQPIVMDRFFYGTAPQPYTRALVERLVLDRKGPSIQFLADLRAKGEKVFAIEGPRTFPHHPKLPRDRMRVGRLEELCREIVSLELSRLGIPSVRLPDEVIDVDGLMRPEFRHESPSDKHHGGMAFGVAMIKQTIGALGSQTLAARKTIKERALSTS